MLSWIDSIYADTTGAFVSNPLPKLGEEVTVFVRAFSSAPVTGVYLRQMVDGAESWKEMKKDFIRGGLQYYAAKILVNEKRCAYHFAFACKDRIIFYNQQGSSLSLPDDSHDFVLLADYPKPDWVDGAVFYQIFPERFASGREELTPKPGQYHYMGHETIVRENWTDIPLDGRTAAGMEFYGGDLYGLMEKIPYLQDLGVTAIYLNPIFSSYSTHKYDCIDYFHVDEHFGGDEALAKLSSSLHEAGMKLILDISINHTGIAHRWVQEGRPYYFKKADGSLEGWCGVETLPVLDYRNEELRDLIYRGDDAVLRKWLRPPYRIDGWRFDVADVFARHGDVQLADEIWPEICAAIREEKRDAIIIGEHWADASRYLQGDMWNTPMNYYGFGRIIRQFVGLPDLFLDRVKGLRDVHYEMQAEDVVRRTKDHYATLPGAIQDCQMNLFDSHDISRLHNNPAISEKEWKMAVTSQLLWVGIPCIYYGDEAAIDGHTESDAGCRYPMPWGHFSERGERHLSLIKKMTELRRSVPAFAKGGRMVLYARGRILAIARFYEEEAYLGILSMEEEETTISLPLCLIGKTAPAGDLDLFGAPVHWKEGEEGVEFRLAPRDSLLFACR